MNDVSKELLIVYEKLDAKGRAAVLRRARRLLARQQKQIAAGSRNRRQPVQRQGIDR